MHHRKGDVSELMNNLGEIILLMNEEKAVIPEEELKNTLRSRAAGFNCGEIHVENKIVTFPIHLLQRDKSISR
jgi:hypothetical protein